MFPYCILEWQNSIYTIYIQYICKANTWGQVPLCAKVSESTPLHSPSCSHSPEIWHKFAGIASWHHQSIQDTVTETGHKDVLVQYYTFDKTYIHFSVHYSTSIIGCDASVWLCRWDLEDVGVNSHCLWHRTVSVHLWSLGWISVTGLSAPSRWVEAHDLSAGPAVTEHNTRITLCNLSAAKVIQFHLSLLSANNYSIF